MPVTPARSLLVAGITAAILTAGDRTILLIVFGVSALAALAWLALRGLPRSISSWLVPIAIAFGPIYLLGAFIAAVTGN